MLKLRRPYVSGLKFNGNLLLRNNVGSTVDNSWNGSCESKTKMTVLYKPKDPEPMRSFNLNLPPTLTIPIPCKFGWCLASPGTPPDRIVDGINVAARMVVPAHDAFTRWSVFFFFIHEM